MARKYGSISDVIHAFSQGEARPETNSSGSVYQEQHADFDVLYSYGRHFPMAIRIKNKAIAPIGTVIFNGDRYSVTTSSHQSGTQRALSGQSVITTSLSALNAATGQRGLHSLLESIKLIDFEDEQSGTSDPPSDATTINYEDELETVKIVWKPRGFNTAEQEQEYKELCESGRGSYHWLDPRERKQYSSADQKRITRKTGRKVVSYWHKPGACIFRQKVTTRIVRHYLFKPHARARDVYYESHEQLPVYERDRVQYRYFLCSMDEREYFIAELPRACKTVKAAFEMLKPLKVRKAEQSGVKVKRQGEWFFLPHIPAGREARAMYKRMDYPFELPRPDRWSNIHLCTRGFTKRNRHYVSGQIRHPEHATLKLSFASDPIIFEAVKNTEKASWTIGGGID